MAALEHELLELLDEEPEELDADDEASEDA